MIYVKKDHQTELRFSNELFELMYFCLFLRYYTWLVEDSGSLLKHDMHYISKFIINFLLIYISEGDLGNRAHVFIHLSAERSQESAHQIFFTFDMLQGY